MADPPLDPLLLGQRVVAILETGLRTATYKLATLTALIDHCIESRAILMTMTEVMSLTEDLPA